MPLIKEGQLLCRSMRRELVTEPELRSQLREQELDDVGNVKEGYIESDGHISVIQYEEKHQSRVERKEK